ncbi:hypothetical protein BK004_04935 [bacterium CG10_46_32]|nr:MAG: hypothetical protein BK004_04935 [bacterium CG10_46_32]PIR55659.1 MAG: hypothetical protein COU73_04985 [Parcubacteria group bacterium CG10_big_fil_rev_8_21_14_0_10_46_32]
MKTLLLSFLHTLTRAVVKKYRPIVIAITGSVGKTATKEAVYAVIATKQRARRSRGNYNTEIGLPLTILAIDWAPGRSPIKWFAVFLRAFGLLVKTQTYPEVLVLEMGTDKPGDIAELLRIVTPTIGVITAISLVHTEQLGDLAGVAREKGSMFRAIGREGTIMVNQDDPEVVKIAEFSHSQRISYSAKQSEGVDVYASEISISRSESSETGIQGMSFKIQTKGTVTPVLINDSLGEHWVYPALVAAAVSQALGLHMVDVAEGLRNFKPEPGRMRVLLGIKHTTIIDDTYNASPASMAAALETVTKLSSKGTTFAVLGDMLELGALSEEEHKKIGRIVAKLPLDVVLITVGERSRDIARGARAAGKEEERVFEFGNVQEAGLFVQNRMEKGDVVLVKGSRGMHMEKIVKEIMAEPLRAKELLVRQSAEWLRKA